MTKQIQTDSITNDAKTLGSRRADIAYVQDSGNRQDPTPQNPVRSASAQVRRASLSHHSPLIRRGHLARRLYLAVTPLTNLGARHKAAGGAERAHPRIGVSRRAKNVTMAVGLSLLVGVLAAAPSSAQINSGYGGRVTYPMVHCNAQLHTIDPTMTIYPDSAYTSQTVRVRLWIQDARTGIGGWLPYRYYQIGATGTWISMGESTVASGQWHMYYQVQWSYGTSSVTWGPARGEWSSYVEYDPYARPPAFHQPYSLCRT